MLLAAHIVLAVRFQDAFAVKDHVFLTLVRCEKLAPFATAHFVNAIIYYVWDVPHVVEVCSRVKLMREHDLATVRPNASGSLRSANDKKETLSRKTK